MSLAAKQLVGFFFRGNSDIKCALVQACIWQVFNVQFYAYSIFLPTLSVWGTIESHPLFFSDFH